MAYYTYMCDSFVSHFIWLNEHSTTFPRCFSIRAIFSISFMKFLDAIVVVLSCCEMGRTMGNRALIEPNQIE